MFAETAVLLFLTRIVEFLGIVTTMFLLFKGYRVRYVLFVGCVVMLSILLSLSSFFFREYVHLIALSDLLVTSLILSGIIFYVSKYPERTRDFTPPEGIRCLMCNVQIIKEDELCVMSIGRHTYFFDSCDHMIKLIKNVDFFLERKKIPRGKVSDVFVRTKDTKRWQKLEKVHIVEEGGIYSAYEKLQENKKGVDLKKLLKDFENKLRFGKS